MLSTHLTLIPRKKTGVREAAKKGGRTNKRWGVWGGPLRIFFFFKFEAV